LQLSQSALPEPRPGGNFFQPGIIFARLGIKTDQLFQSRSGVIEYITASAALRDIAVGIEQAKHIAIAQFALLEEFSFHSLCHDCAALRREFQHYILNQVRPAARKLFEDFYFLTQQKSLFAMQRRGLRDVACPSYNTASQRRRACTSCHGEMLSSRDAACFVPRLRF
jgi:hypothetical protein